VRSSKFAAFLLLASGLLATTAPSQAAERQNKLIWKRIVGIARQDPSWAGHPAGADCNIGVDCVEGTPAQWTTTEGRAEVDLDHGRVEFSVKGLVLAADPSFTNIGTPGDITLVKGTLVCNDTQPGVPELVDTDAVALSSRGNASFRGHVDLPASCVAEPLDMVFLIRIADPENFLFDFYNAFGAVRIGPGEGEPNGSD